MSLDLKHIRLRAIAAGLLTDIGGSVATWMLGSFLLAIIAQIKHVPFDDFSRGIGNGIFFQFFFMVNGLMFSCAGAMVTSMLSRPYSVLNALLFGILTTLFSLCFFTTTFDIGAMLGCIIIPPMSVAVGFLVSLCSR
ncbi:hypothetical protein BH09VER1_BH09VER1_13660 [soil metagenome]